jgi:hypothetical protein
MRKQRVMFTALPNGLSDSGALKLTVFVSPRLVTDEGTTLALFPDFVDWPGRHVTFKVRMGALPLMTPTVTSAAPRSDVWTNLFPSTSPLRSYVYPSLANRRVRSYPASNVRAWIRDFYVWLVTNHATDFPTMTDLVGQPDSPGGPALPGRMDDIRFGLRPGPNNSTRDTQKTVINQINSTLTAQQAVPPGPLNPARDFTQVTLFHQRDPVVGDPAPPAAPDFDFHDAVSLCADHPPLLRILGLAIDLEVLLPSGGAQSPISVVAQWTPLLTNPPVAGQTSEDITIKTATDVVPFLPAPRPKSPEVNDGLLALDDTSRFSLVELDLDTAALRLMDLARGLDRIVYGIDGVGGFSPRSAATAEDSSVPSLRSAGLTISRAGRASQLVTDLKRADSVDGVVEPAPAGKPTVYAEDVTRGYRIDVHDATRNQWFPLFARVGANGGYQVGSPPLAVPMPASGDEGCVQLAVSEGQVATSTDLSLPEGAARWAGWSLAAPRDGKVHSTDPKAPLEPQPDNAPGTFKLEATYAAKPSTLPALRFGRTYRFRARSVDVAGNSLPFDPTADAASFTHATPAITYRRFEPVPTPALAPRALLTAGETTHRIVIRSNYNTPNSGVPASERHVLPTRTAQLFAEEHGAFDMAPGVPDPTKYAQIKNRDGKNVAGGLSDSNNGDQPYFNVNTLAVPYFPEVLARGAAFEGLPGGPATGTVQVPFYPNGDTWPVCTPFRIRAVAGPAGIGSGDLPTATKRQLLVRLPKATVATVRLSAFVNPEDLDLLGVWGWVTDAGPVPSSLLNATLAGLNWLLTPYHEIELIHAVRQPLVRPSLVGWTATRALGDTTASLSGDVKISRVSTKTVDIAAHWTEPVDDPTSGPPTTRTADVTFAHTELVRDDPAGPVVPYGTTPGRIPLTHEFGDTKYRLVRYRATATSSFVEFFRETATKTLNGLTPTVVDANGLVPATVNVQSNDGSVTFKEDVDYAVDLGAGTIARIGGSAITDGASVRVSYVAQPVTRDSREAPVPPADTVGYPVRVRSSASPAVLDLRTVVPSFAWTTSGNPSSGAFHSTRAGGGLRIFVGRPWFSSGDGELLGVLVPNGPLPSGPIPPEISVRGEDPLFGNMGLSPHSSPLTLADFPLATAHNASVLGGGFSVAGHPVVYDAARDLWYADIEVSEAALYSPFVRLALVRFQPNSLPGAEVGPVVTADPIKLTPTRSTTRTATNSPSKWKITVKGPGPIAVQGDPIEVTLQQRDNSLPTDVGWTNIGSATFLPFMSWNSGVATWSGIVTIPGSASGTLRLKVREYESYVVDPATSATGQRTVYLDTIPLS